MLISSLQIALRNSSTIESLDWGSKVWTLAILIPRPLDLDNLPPNSRPPFPVVCYPTSASQPGAAYGGNNSSRRQFAILHTRPGENPFDLGDPFANLGEVMGHSMFDWVLPIKHSPCASHGRQDSMYALGPVVQRMKREAGLLETPARKSGNHSQRTQRRRRDGRSSDSDPSSSRSTSSRSRGERNKTNRRQTKGPPKPHRRSRDGGRSIRNNRLSVEGT